MFQKKGERERDCYTVSGSIGTSHSISINWNPRCEFMRAK